MTVPAASARPAVWRAGQVMLTVGLLTLLWSAVDGPDVLHALGQAQLGWVGAAVIALILQTTLSAWRWKITAAGLGQSLPLTYAIREYFLSQSVNQAAPGAVLGDAARAVRARGTVGLATAGLAVALERFAGQVAMFLTLACALLVTSLTPGGLDLAPAHGGPVLAGVAVLAGAALLLALSSRHTGRGLRKWVRLSYQGLLAPRVLPAQILLGLAITACNLAAFGLCAFAVGVALSPAALLTLVPLILFSMLIPFTVSGWGVREGSAALLLPLAGVAATEAIAASVVFGIALLISVLPGFAIMVAR